MASLFDIQGDIWYARILIRSITEIDYFKARSSKEGRDVLVLHY
jgi:hypothetical protein